MYLFLFMYIILDLYWTALVSRLYCKFLINEFIKTNRLFAESKRIEEGGGYQFEQKTVPTTFNFGIPQ